MSLDHKPGEPVRKDTLLEAIHNLTDVVKALQNTLENDYPTRAEVRKRRWQLAWTLVIAIVASYFFTVGTVSYCFLGGIPEPGTHNFCSIFPGYTESFDSSRDLRDRFIDLENFVNDSRDRIRELEQE